jgi:hypothetical protein
MITQQRSGPRFTRKLCFYAGGDGADALKVLAKGPFTRCRLRELKRIEPDPMGITMMPPAFSSCHFGSQFNLIQL